LILSPNKIKKKLSEGIPGQAAQYLMAPEGRERPDLNNFSEEGLLQSAVMLLICYDEQNQLFIPLIERCKDNSIHAGQVSLPGGKVEPTDVSYHAAALRECFEEIGIDVTAIEILGQLTKLYIPVSGFMVQPVVGFCKVPNAEFVINKMEVKTMVKLPVGDLLNEQIIGRGVFESGAEKIIKAPYYEVAGYRVWGATAMILSEFKEVLRSIF
jgi:hypothetical protein